MAFARAEREVFDVEAEIDRQPLAVRPRIVRAVNDWRVSITIVIGKLHIGIPARRVLTSDSAYKMPSDEQVQVLADGRL
jgi:hypothetical protein